MRAFTEHMGASCKDTDLDGDPKTTEYGREEEMVTLYDDGVPEMKGRKTVEKLFGGESQKNYMHFGSIVKTTLMQAPNGQRRVSVLWA